MCPQAPRLSCLRLRSKLQPSTLTTTTQTQEMEDRLQAMRDTLQDALDDLSSTRTSSEVKMRALHRIERHLAAACISKDSSDDLFNFNALQYTFECNVPLRLISWIGASTSTLEALTNKGSMDSQSEMLASKLSSQLALSLSLIQGVSLNHSSSKAFLGRKYALEVLIDLLLASRHLPASTLSSTDTPSRTAASMTPPLSSVVIDTLLCILVDAPLALRAFEDATGTQAVVKILKRAGTPREVRMKCLEFLYFYLLDENPQSAGDSLIPLPTSPPTTPATPLKPSKPYLNSKPLRPSSSRFASELSFPSNKTSTSTSSTSSTPRSTSSGSFSSTSSNTSSSTAPSSTSSSSVKPMYPPKTPPRSPSLPHRLPHRPQPRSLMMLRKEVEYEPQSPKKPQLSRAGSGSASRNASTQSMSRLRAVTEDDYRKYNQLPGTPSRHEQSGTMLHHEMPKPQGRAEKIRTTEEKKELLGTMLGNVDALVEGVRKAGIWGLG